MSRLARAPRHTARLILATVVVLLSVTAGAQAAESYRVVPVAGTVGPGPSSTNEVRVLEQGPSNAKKILLLNPGTSASASYFKPLADELLARLPGWQVWSIARRETLLEDTTMLDEADAGVATPKQMFDYYLGWLNDSTVTNHFQPVSDDNASYARGWGMRVAIEDLHKVVALARKGGREVVMGGHSLGGSITEAYATWDFNGRAGAKDLSGLVFIDGAGGGRAPLSTKDAAAGLKQINTGSPFLDLTGLGLPWSAGVFNAIGSRLALLAPDAPSLLGQWALLPPFLKAPELTTNEAAYGYALDTQTGPPSLALVQMHLGHLADSGDPRPWVDGELVTVARAATVFSGIPGMDGSSWYHPRRLSLDAGAINGGLATPSQKLLDVRTTHGRDVHLPIYAYATSLGNTRVLDAARALAKQSKVPAAEVKLVNRAKTNAHIDPIADPAATNDFIKTVVPFLRKIR